MKQSFPLFVLLMTGCAATVTCTFPEEPTTTAYLFDHGRHSSLALPTPEGRLVRYSYGDRRWYLEMDTGLRQGAAALLLRTPAVLGRRELHLQTGAEDVTIAVRVSVEQVYPLRVDADRAAALQRELDDLFFSGSDARRYNDAYDLEFVPHPRDYTGWFNSNHMVAAWVEESGCQVRGTPMFSRWRVDR